MEEKRKNWGKERKNCGRAAEEYWKLRKGSGRAKKLQKKESGRTEHFRKSCGTTEFVFSAGSIDDRYAEKSENGNNLRHS